ncbi:FAD/NAD(P)-binding domain-containing protein [Panus rudis PR-1116 ss-1]|nr:FAD/NAD(P)-binding domain-containing protein [Panus rudis PR-1116 ss-1]
MSATKAEYHNLSTFTSDSLNYARSFDIFSLLSPTRFIIFMFDFFYIALQRLIIWTFKPRPPKYADQPTKPRGRIAVIGAGLTGVSSAAHAIAHGFDVVIYEKDDRVGGIWAHVNSTSGLQLNSLLYRFHPGVLWSCAFPLRDEILGEITRIWKEYKLDGRTRFNTPVTSVKPVTQDENGNPVAPEDDFDPSKQGHRRWIVNDGKDGIFDAVIVTVGTCGKPRMVKFEGMPSSDEQQSENQNKEHSGLKREKSHGGDDDTASVTEGPIIHSSQLDSLDEKTVKGKTVVVIGSGASGVEAVETALSKGAKNTVILAREDKWIIPRNIIVDTLIAAQPFGRQMPLSFIWEKIVTWWNYRGIEDLTPAHLGLFEGTPVVNDEFLQHVRNGKCKYIRGDIERLTKKGVKVNARTRESKPGDKGEIQEIDADVIVLATGYEKPNVDFIEADLFPEGYERPNLYLQNFSTEDWSVLMTNSAYQNAIGTVGHFHIGIYTRILLTLLMDKDARPSPKDMKLWVDVLRFVKRGARGGALGFFTYMELTIWLLLFHILRPDRIRWVFFIMQGWGVYPDEYR